MHTLYAKQEGNHHVITVSLLLHKTIDPENLLADEFDLPQSFWTHFTNAFRSMQRDSLKVNGYMYDPKLTDGLVAIHRSRIGLEEMIAEAGNNG